MKFEFKCPQCNLTLATETDNVGQKGKCPQCETIIEIPAPEPTSSSQPHEAETTGAQSG